MHTDTELQTRRTAHPELRKPNYMLDLKKPSQKRPQSLAAEASSNQADQEKNMKKEAHEKKLSQLSFDELGINSFKNAKMHKLRQIFLSHQDFRNTINICRFDSLVGSDTVLVQEAGDQDQDKDHAAHMKPGDWVEIRGNAISRDTQTARTANNDRFGGQTLRNSKSQTVSAQPVPHQRNEMNLRMRDYGRPPNVQLQSELRGASLRLQNHAVR